MATITVTSSLIVGNSDLISVYNPNILKWTATPNNDSLVISSIVTLIMLDGNKAFDAVFTKRTVVSGGQDTFEFEMDITSILKYGINDYYHKSVSDGANISDLVRIMPYTIRLIEGSSSTRTVTSALTLSHGYNQIGNPSGSNMRGIYDNEPMKANVSYFLPWELYFFIPSALTVRFMRNKKDFPVANKALTKGLHTIYAESLNVKGDNTLDIFTEGTSKLTTWTNFGYNTFTSSGANITSAIETSGNGADCTSNNMSFTGGKTALIYINLTQISGVAPVLNIGSTKYQLKPGLNRYFIKTSYTQIALTLLSGQVANFSVIASVTELDYYQHIDFKVIVPCGDEKYIRFLSREGFYRYWLFGRFSKRLVTAKKIGELSTRVTDMTTAVRRSRVIGYEDVFTKIDVASHNVSIADQEILMDIFTSPSVYLYENFNWISVQIEGSHTINTRSEFSNFSATIVLPESYSQTL